MSVGSLEEIIDDNHAIVSTSVGSEHYVSILSFVDKDQLEPGHKKFLIIFYLGTSCPRVNVVLGNGLSRYWQLAYNSQKRK